jgi:hypothetical protein
VNLAMEESMSINSWSTRCHEYFKYTKDEVAIHIAACCKC